jgi:hypothetical protein
MRNILHCAVSVSALLALATPAQSSMPMAGRPLVDRLAQPVFCTGNRRSYRSFSHCWAINGRIHPRIASYCSRICPNYGRN